MKKISKLSLVLLSSFGLALSGCNIDQNNKQAEEFVIHSENNVESGIVEHGIKLTQIKKSGGNNSYYSTVTFAYTVLPSNATNKRINTYLSFADNRTASDYLEVVVDSTNCEITLNALQGFDSLATLRIVSQVNSSAYANVTVHCMPKLTIDWEYGYNYPCGALVKSIVDNDGGIKFGYGSQSHNPSTLIQYGYTGVNTEGSTYSAWVSTSDFTSMGIVSGFSDTDCITDVNFDSSISSTMQTTIKRKLYTAMYDWLYRHNTYSANTASYSYGYKVENFYLREYIHYQLDCDQTYNPQTSTTIVNNYLSCFDSSKIEFHLKHVYFTCTATNFISNNTETINTYDRIGDTFDLRVEITNRAVNVSSLSATNPDVYL